MKPNLINYNIIQNELKNSRYIKDFNTYTIFNIVLLVIIVGMLFMIFYVFRDKTSKKTRVNNTIKKLEYIAKLADDEINKRNKNYYTIDYET